MSEEIFDVVNERDEVIGRVDPSARAASVSGRRPLARSLQGLDGQSQGHAERETERRGGQVERAQAAHG